MNTTPTVSAEEVAALVGRNVGLLLRRRAEVMGERPAFASAERALTWAQLDERVARLAGALRADGLGEGARFAHVDRNHLASIESTFAAAYGGLTHVTVNWRLAPEELAYVLADSAAEILLVGHELVDKVEEVRGLLPALRKVVVVGGPADEYEPWLGAAAPLRDFESSGPGDCLLQMYTSGTTGRPKGAMLSNAGLGLNAIGQAAQQGLGEDSVHLIAMPLFHIGGQAMAMISLCAGCRTIVTVGPDPDLLLRTVEHEQVTHLFLVPTSYEALVDAGIAAGKDLSSLTCLLYSGAPMPRAVLDRGLSAFPNATAVTGGYGMTEISGMASALPAAEHRNQEHPERLGSVGRVMPSLQWRVVDPADHADLPSGSVGELWLKGPGVMIGYWNRPEATAETVVDGWLRTGDLVTYDADGYLYIRGRLKEMIISGGENVYPQEIERVVGGLPGVVECAAYAVPHPSYGESVAVAVVREPGSGLTEAEVMAACTRSLAKYKCPREIRFLDSLPRTVTGKLQRHQLRHD